MGITDKAPSMTAPPSYTPNVDNSAMYDAALESYQQQSEQAIEANKLMFEQELSALAAQQEEFEAGLPDIIGADQAQIDWSAKNEELKAKMKANFETEQAMKKSRTSTIVTSPLLDDEDPVTSTSILTGS